MIYGPMAIKYNKLCILTKTFSQFFYFFHHILKIHRFFFVIPADMEKEVQENKPVSTAAEKQNKQKCLIE